MTCLGLATTTIKRQSPLLLKHQARLLSCTSNAVRTSIDTITSGEEMSAMHGRETTMFPADYLPDSSHFPCSHTYTSILWRTNSPYSSTLVKAWPHLLQQSCKLANSSGSSILNILIKKQEKQFALRVRMDQDDARRQAAVLVPICSVQGVPSLLFTVRAAHMKHHASEVCFPGGHVDDEIDSSFVDTALREANEELVPPPGFLRNVEIVGQAAPIPSSLGGTPVTPIIGVIWPELPNPVSSWFPGNPSEVAAVFSVPIQELYENDAIHHNNEQQQYVASMNNQQNVMAAPPTFPTPFGDIWGLTANILYPILHRILKPVFLASHENNDNNNIQYGHHDEATTRRRRQQGRRREVCF